MNIFQNYLEPENVPPDDDHEEYQEDNSIDTKIKNENHRKLLLANEKEENNLIEKKMINAVLGEIQHSIHTNFVDLPRRESPTIAARMGVPEKERDLEKMLQEKIKISLIAVKSTVAKLLDDGIYE